MTTNGLHPLEALLRERVVVLDGAMGTMIQRYKLSETDYRGQRFGDWKGKDLKGSLGLLNVTRPQIVEEIHAAYLDAGADVIETNTSSGTTIGLHDFLFQGEPKRGRKDQDFFRRVLDDVDLRALVREMNLAAAKIARRAADRTTEQSGVRRFVGGSMGPLPVTASISPDAKPLVVALNCSLGPDEMSPFIEELARVAPFYVGAYPNAGLPDPLSETGFPETPETLAPKLKRWTENGWLNLVGGCCGTTPEHIRAIVTAVRDCKPRSEPDGHYAQSETLQLSGLEPLNITPEFGFAVIGERTNITGSPKFSKLILSDDFDGALAVARQQVQGGANMLDINMDEGMIDSEATMTRFLNLIASEPEIARIPIMIDSSKWSVIEAGLKCVQGKAVVNSIRLKNGEEEFLR